MVKKDDWNDFNFFKFAKARFMAQDVIYPGGGSVCTSEKGEINNNTIIVGDFNNPLTPMDRSIKQKINKETQTLNDTMDQLDLIVIYRTFHPKTMNLPRLALWPRM